MADFRPLVLDGSSLEELDGTNDRLIVRDLVSVVNSADSLRWNSNSFLVSIANNHRFVVDADRAYFRTVGLNTTNVNIWSNETSGDARLTLGGISAFDQEECVINYNLGSFGDNAKKLSINMEGVQSGINKIRPEVVGIQTHQVGIGSHHRTAFLVPSRGNSAGNTGTRLTRYYETKGINNYSEVGTNVDAAAVQFGCGVTLIKAGNHNFGGTVEFIKTRAADIGNKTQSEFNALAAPQNDDVLGQIIAGGTVGSGTSDAPISALMAFHANQTWTSSPSKRGSYVVFITQEYVSDTAQVPLTIGKEIGTSDAVGGKTIQLPVAPTGSGSAYLRVDGNRNVIVQSSSKRYKKNIKDVTLKQCQNIVDNLRPVRFEFKGETIQQYGLIAEEVEQVDKVLATHNNDGEVESVNYESIAVMLLKVVKDQQKQITKLETRIAALEG